MRTKGRLNRRHIVAAAAPIFNVKGFAGTSIADILEATGLEKGGLYYHFASKDELALAALDHALRMLERRHALAQAGWKSAVGRLIASVNVVANSVHHPVLRGGCPILNTAIEADDTHSQLRDRAAEAMRGWHERVTQIIREGIASGEIRAGTSPAVVASILTSALEGAVMVTALLKDPVHNATRCCRRCRLPRVTAYGLSRKTVPHVDAQPGSEMPPVNVVP